MGCSRCQNCERLVDHDVDEGYFCPHCQKFSCDRCWDGLVCPICNKETEL